MYLYKLAMLIHSKLPISANIGAVTPLYGGFISYNPLIVEFFYKWLTFKTLFSDEFVSFEIKLKQNNSLSKTKVMLKALSGQN